MKSSVGGSAYTNGAITSNCWDDNSSGQLGDGTTTQRLTSTALSGLTSGVAAIVNGSLQCWGRGDYGQLGNNNWLTSLIPTFTNPLY